MNDGTQTRHLHSAVGKNVQSSGVATKYFFYPVFSSCLRKSSGDWVMLSNLPCL